MKQHECDVTFVVTEVEERGDGDDETSPVLALCNGVIPVVEHLRHNSHIQLAFTFSQHMLFTLLQYIQQQDMGLPMYTEVIVQVSSFKKSD